MRAVIDAFSDEARVAMWIIEAGGTETEAIAALLDDLIDDTGVPLTMPGQCARRSIADRDHRRTGASSSPIQTVALRSPRRAWCASSSRTRNCSFRSRRLSSTIGTWMYPTAVPAGMRTDPLVVM